MSIRFCMDIPLDLFRSACTVGIRTAVLFGLLAATSLNGSPVTADDRALNEDPDLAAYFESEVSRIERDNSLLKYRSLEEWTASKPKLRAELFEMLGLQPLPERGPLHAEVTRTSEHAEFRVERLHFQSLPGLYVTGNLYLPRQISGRLPAILYLCGHGEVSKDGVSYGNKVRYQHHGAWYARHGFICLTIDSLQLGEIQGIHHGTYRYNRWWWNARGYTPAGVEAWNCIRALDYLQSRPEVDGNRLGVTGRSGGGAYSWWIAALDDRIQCAVPVAGITTLRNHVIDGCVEGHCDCMFMVNTCRWDYATVAALVAPRPLLISNTDKDGIFPLEGVVEIHRQVRHIYELFEKPGNLGLQITEGPHEDTQELHLHSFRWMNRFLRQDESLIEKTAVPFFEPEQLKVFAALPADERNTRIDAEFVPAAAEPSDSTRAEILDDPQKWFDSTRDELRSACFFGWPEPEPTVPESSSGTAQKPVRMEVIPLTAHRSVIPETMRLTRVHFDSQPHVPLFFDLLHHRTTRLSAITHLEFRIVGDEHWDAWQMLTTPGPHGSGSQPEDEVMTAVILKPDSEPGQALAVFAPRGMGVHRWKGDARKQVQIQRRFQLIGQTVDGMRAWDIRRAIQTARAGTATDLTIALHSDLQLSLPVLFAALFEPPVASIHLAGHATGEEQPTILNQMRVVSVAELMALTAYRTTLHLPADDESAGFSRGLATSPGWPGRQVLAGSGESVRTINGDDR